MKKRVVFIAEEKAAKPVKLPGITIQRQKRLPECAIGVATVAHARQIQKFLCNSAAFQKAFQFQRPEILKGGIAVVVKPVSF